MRTIDIERALDKAAPLLSPGAQFISAPEFEFFKRGGHRAGGAWESPAIEIMAQQPIRTDDYPIARGEPMRPWPRSRGAASVFPRIPTTGANAVAFVRSAAYFDNPTANPIDQGDNKQSERIQLELALSPLGKIAVTVAVTEEIFEDLPGLQGFIDSYLLAWLDQAYDNIIVNGSGGGWDPNDWPNISNSTYSGFPGLVSQLGDAAFQVNGYWRSTPGESNAAAILNAAVSLFLQTGIIADTILIRPQAWPGLVLRGVQLDQGGGNTNDSGIVDLDGPVWAPLTWAGFRIALAPMTAGAEAIVGNFAAGCALYEQPMIAVSATNSHDSSWPAYSGFAENIITLRAERRAALAVFNPAAFIRVTGLMNVAPVTARGARTPNGKSSR